VPAAIAPRGAKRLDNDTLHVLLTRLVDDSHEVLHTGLRAG
jgi:hypothetical protein